MSDSLYQTFQHYGTNAERLAFTPDPPALATGEQPIYSWWVTDAGANHGLWVYDTGWSQVGGGSGTIPATVQGDMLYASGTNTLAALAKDTNATRYLSNTGASNNPAWAQVALATGISGLGAGVATFLATPSSANLASAVTDETGDGALVFANEPVLTGEVTIGGISFDGGTFIAPMGEGFYLASNADGAVFASLELSVAGVATLSSSDTVVLNPTTSISLNGPTLLGAHYLEITEMTAPSAPAANGVRIFARDTGGKTELCCLFNSGAIQQIKIEP